MNCPLNKFQSSYVLLCVSFLLLCGLSFAYFTQYVLGVEPCTMCYTQRYLYMAAIVATLFAALFGESIKRLKCLSALVLAATLGYSAYHVGVEQKWWKGPESCTSHGQKLDLNVATNEDPIERLKKHLEDKKVVLCDEVGWRLLGIPATVLDTLFLLILFVIHVRINLRCLRNGMCRL